LNAPSNFFVHNLWYYALPAVELKPGGMVSKLLLGEPVVFVRTNDGTLFALRDICPHRGMPLSYGRLVNEDIECCYHGWRFNTVGACTCIPSLAGHEGILPENIQVRSYRVQESQGGIWIYMDDPKIRTGTLPPIPIVPEIPVDLKPAICEVLQFPCNIDHAVMGLMDPAHGPFVHQSWWWRSRHSIHEKAKAFGPSHLGFTMQRHRPSKNSFGYKLLGGVPETEISFQLPGIRIEYIHAGKCIIGNLTCVTPIDDTKTEITHSIYISGGWLRLLTPVVRIFARRFLNQDRDVVIMQQDGLRYERNLMLIRDADTQARWYQQIKNEFARAQEEDRAFNNPVKNTVLKWRS
jgi:phenylpropionate dioxygenase-like ring-hydroxylating dioxygenase large terminal subunit